MATTISSAILRALSRVVEDQRVKALPDQELLQRFTVGGDEAAFHTLLLRYGPTVLRICRALLPSEDDVEDAFQATFLVFARKAGSIRRTSTLGNWLQGVAYRTAHKARAEFAKRQKHERRVPRLEACPPEDLTWREVQCVLHEELSGLSEGYRVPLTLYYLQGMTVDEAAERLGLSKGTLKARLERGRGLLRARLVRRGLGSAVVLLAAAWPGSAAGLISTRVATLTEGVLKAMLVSKLKTATVTLAILAFVGLGLGGVAYTTAAQKPDSEGGQRPPALMAQAERPPAEQKAIAALRAVGGRVVIDRTQPGEPVVAVYLLSRDCKDEHLKHLKEFKHLKTLVLPGITDATVNEIRELKGVERLRARPDDGKVVVEGLGGLANLRELELGQVEDAGLQEIGKLKNLRVLKLNAWRVSAEGLKELKGLKELRRLELNDLRNVGAGLTVLVELENLEQLSLKGGIDDAVLKHVAKIKHLRVLHLTNNQVTDEGLTELTCLPNLRQVFLRNTRGTDTGIADLKKAVPGLEVTKAGRGVPPRTWEDYERITGTAGVLDAKTLLFADGTRVRLNMRVPEPGEKGAREAAEFLARLIGAQTVTCYLIEAQLAYSAYVGDVNVEYAMVVNGWARADHSGMEPAETIARENKRGIWAENVGAPGR
jgi:RNA polymerase sigma factor (sigma-70 family)